MEYYKNVKKLGITAGETLDLGGSEFNHKGAIIVTTSGSNLVNIKGYSKNVVDPLGLTYNCQNTSSLDVKSIIPLRIAKVTPAFNGNIFLFN